MSLSGAQIITRALRVEGVDTIFTVAGDHILPLLDVLDDEGFRLIDCRHEQAAVHMAEGWARMTGKLGVVAVTTPGHANALPGLINAMSTESPVLNIAGSAEVKNYHRGVMQEIDQVGIARTVTKGAWLAHDPRRIPDLMSTAIRTAFEGRRGPVHLTVPVDVQSAVVDDEETRFFDASSYRRTQPIQASHAAVEQAVAMLRAAERPVVVASTPAAYGDWSSVYERFIETTKLPFMTEEAARGIVSDDHPYCFGFFDLSQHTAANLIREADVVLFLGKLLDFTIGYGLGPVVPSDAKVIQVEPDPLQVGRNRGVDLSLVGDVGPIVEQLADEAARTEWPELSWLERFRTAVVEQKGRLEQVRHGRGPFAVDVCPQRPGQASAGRRRAGLRRRRLRVLRARVPPGQEPAQLVVLAEPGPAGPSRSGVDCGQAGEAGVASVLHHGRRRFRVQRHGTRHRRAPQAQGGLPRWERRGVGHRQEPAAGPVRQGRNHRPGPLPVRLGRAGVGARTRSWSSVRRSWSPRWSGRLRRTARRC